MYRLNNGWCFHSAKSNHLIGSIECSYCIVFSYDAALSGAESVSTKEMESEDIWSIISYSNDP